MQLLHDLCSLVMGGDTSRKVLCVLGRPILRVHCVFVEWSRHEDFLCHRYCQLVMRLIPVEADCRRDRPSEETYGLPICCHATQRRATSAEPDGISSRGRL